MSKTNKMNNLNFNKDVAMYGQRGIVSSVRLNKQMKHIILTMITEMKENASIIYEGRDEMWDRFLEAMEYLTQEIGVKSPLKRIKLTKKIGWTLSCFMWDNKHHYFACGDTEPEFENAMNWIISKVNKKYSQFELCRWADDEPRKK
jgi:hypothetical protein